MSDTYNLIEFVINKAT